MHFYNNKKGVSLVAVLLFMLVATIAGTATYKWLSSAGFSSANRMRMREAEYAADAGIASARNWMTYHGNETGALIYQYLSDSDKKPILMDSVLNPLLKEGQKYKVWFVGADIGSNPYTVKILAEGYTADEQTKYRKVSVMNVNGLYRVLVPKMSKKGDFEEAVFAGATGGISLDVTSGIVNGDANFNTEVDVDKRLIVVGDLNVNSSTRIKDLYVSGNVYTCTNFSVSGNAYVSGKVYVNGYQTYEGDLYAEGGIDLSGRGADGKAYCNTGFGGGLTIGGNLTVDNDFITPQHTAANKYIVKGNTVLNNGAKLVFPDIFDPSNSGMIGNQGYEVNLLGNVYLSGGINDGYHEYFGSAKNFVLGSAGKYVYSGTKLYRISDAYGMISATTDYSSWWPDNEVKTLSANVVTYKDKWGNQATSQMQLASNTFCNGAYCTPTDYGNGANFYHNADFYTCSDTVNQAGVKDRCNYTKNEIFFQVNGTYVPSVDTTGWGADRQNDLKDMIVDHDEGNCKGPHVSEPLQFNENLLSSAKMHSKDSKGACAGGVFEPQYSSSFWSEDNSIDRWELLEKCYDAAKNADELYDNEWLLIRFSGSNNQFQNTQKNVTLRKKYIIVFEENNTYTLPPTSSDANVMMYWMKGGTMMLLSNAPYRNYFIYSAGDIEYNGGAGKPITGSIYMADCHKIRAVNTIVAEFNQTVVSELSTAAALCAYDGTKKCVKKSSAGEGSGTGSYDAFTDADYDPYIIAVSPQLLLTTKSEYKANERDLGTLQGTPEPSILVMPRILYLSRKPSGKLSDYIEVLNLNGATEVKNTSNVTCNPAGLPTTERFSSYADSLDKGVYTCNYMSSTYGDALFYVMVDGSVEDLKVNFEKDFVEVASGAPGEVYVEIPKSESNGKNITMDIYMSPLPQGWTVTGLTPTATNSDGSAVYTLTATPLSTEQKVLAFTVDMPENGVPSSLIFQFIPPYSGAKPGPRSLVRVGTAGTVTVERHEVREYCGNHFDICNENGVSNKYYAASNAPDCNNFLKKNDNSTDIWVYARGSGCVANATDPNKYWQCSMHESITLRPQSGVNANVQKYCDVVIPDVDNKFDPQSDNEVGILYGSLVRKSKTLTVTVSETNSPETKILIKQNSDSEQNDPDPSAEVYECKGGQVCQILVFPGYKYFLIPEEKGSDKFSYFSCEGVDCVEASISTDKLPILVSANNSVFATFNEKDSHCFYEDFSPADDKENFVSFCGNGKTRCIDTCAVAQASGQSCEVTKGAQTEMQNETPDWVMVYNNREAGCNRWKLSDICDEYYAGGNICKTHRRLCTDSYKKSGTSQLAPKISNNYLHANNSSDADAMTANSVQAVVLNTRDAGYNGSMTSYFKTNADPIHNSGFIFRSNDDASEYYELNIYGNASFLGSLVGASNRIYAELCLLHGQGNGDNSKDICVEKQLATSSYALGSSLTISENTTLTLVLNISGPKVDVSIGLDRVFLKDGEKGISFDLMTEFNGQVLADNKHNRVGLKLSNSNFRVYDISWTSETFSKSCYAPPKLLCSFKANYLGGNIPVNSDVTPWVAYSSWSDNNKYNSCHLDYYYNGCDLASGYTSFTWNDWSGWYQYFSCGTGGNKDGSYWDRGSTMKDQYYNFVDEGPHGFAYTPAATNLIPNPYSGIKKDAKVKINCDGSDVEPPSTMMNPKTCGEFLVGELKFCSENYDFMKTQSMPIQCEANKDCDIPASWAFTNVYKDTSVNLRDGSVALEFQNDFAADISIMLVDKAGKTSSVRHTEGDGYTVDVNTVANTDLFDPQSIVAIRLKGTDAFSVTSAISGCPYALGISGCSVAYNGTSWEVKVSATNALNCDIKPSSDLSHLSDAAKEQVICDEEGTTYTFTDPSFYNRLENAGTFNFEVTARSDNGEVTKTCSSEELVPLTVEDCSIDAASVMPGMGVPAFGFKLANCSQLSSGKCPYVVTLDGMTLQGSTDYEGAATGSVAPFNDLNQPGSKYAVDGIHTWKVTTAKSSCEKTFTVEAIGDASAVCALDKDSKVFSAAISPSGVWSAYVNVYDAQGHDVVIGAGRVNNQPKTDESFSVDLSEYVSEGYIVTFVLNGTRQDNCMFTYSTAASSSSAAPASSETPASSATPASSESSKTGKICMVKTVYSWEHHPKVENITAGTYTLEHTCGDTKEWYVYCTSGMSITLDNITYACQGEGASILGYNVNKIPPSGSKFVVPEGMKIKSMSCINRNTIIPVAPPGCPDNGVVDGPVPVTPSSSSTSGSTTCNFANSSHNWGDNGQIKIKSTCTNCSYVVKSPSGEVKASGTTPNNANQEENVNISTIAENGNYSVYVNGAAAASCTANPNLPEMKTSYCTTEKSNLAPGASTKFKANITSCNNYACNWYLKKNGTKVNNGTYGNYIEPYITGPGTYTLHLLSESADATCSVTIDGASPAENCKMADNSRSYGEKTKFQVQNMSIGRNSSWELLDPAGSSVLSGTFNGDYNSSWFETGEFIAKVDGSYKLKVDGADACSANLSVTQPSVSNCAVDQSTLTVGQNTTFKFNLNNCKNNQCSYEVKIGDEVVESKENESDGYKSFNVTADESGTYKVWLNGVETTCSADVTVTGEYASPGTYDYCIDQYNNNMNISGKFKNGKFKFNLCKSCEHIRINANRTTNLNGLGTDFFLNNIVSDCKYIDDYHFAQPRKTLEFNIESKCVVTNIYVWDCK